MTLDVWFSMGIGAAIGVTATIIGMGISLHRVRKK